MSGDLSNANVLIKEVKRIVNDAQFFLSDDAKRILRTLETTAREDFEIGSGALPTVKIAVGKIFRELRAKTKTQRMAKDELQKLISK